MKRTRGLSQGCLGVLGVSSQIRWLTHIGREVPPSGLKPNSRKTPPLVRRVELLGTIALHCWLSVMLYRDALQGKRPAVRFVEVTP
jgi:hypothetical protein